MLISFPHNPTTICVDLDFMNEVVALAREHGSYVIHDFAYAELGFDGYRPPSILQVEGANEHCIEIYSMTKSYNMAGWRVGFCLGNRKLIGALARIKSYLDYGIFQPIQIASIIALRECEGAPAQICSTYQDSPRRAVRRAESRWMGSHPAKRFNVRMGAHTRAIPEPAIAGIR